jgi:hypothetical protein
MAAVTKLAEILLLLCSFLLRFVVGLGMLMPYGSEYYTMVALDGGCAAFILNELLVGNGLIKRSF